MYFAEAASFDFEPEMNTTIASKTQIKKQLRNAIASKSVDALIGEHRLKSGKSESRSDFPREDGGWIRPQSTSTKKKMIKPQSTSTEKKMIKPLTKPYDPVNWQMREKPKKLPKKSKFIFEHEMKNPNTSRSDSRVSHHLYGKNDKEEKVTLLEDDEKKASKNTLWMFLETKLKH